MTKLTAFLHGQSISEIELIDGNEYIIGRSEDCAMILPPQRGISRLHLKVFQRGGQWIAEGLSRFVPLQKDGDSLPSIELNSPTVFMAPPYEFRFEENIPATPEAEAPSDSPGESSDEMVARKPRPELEDTVIRGNLDMTVAGKSPLCAYLRVRHPRSGDQEVLRLEGDFWVAGRESVSEIRLPDPRASRRHFELSKSGDGYFVTDLGSANGTRINGQAITSHEPTQVESGDTISVLGFDMLFEIRDSNLAERLQRLPQVEFFPSQAMIPAPQAPPMPRQPPNAMASHEPEDWRNWRPQHLRKFDWKKNKVRVLLMGLVPVLLIGLFQGHSPSTPTTGKTNEPPAFEKLTAEQKNSVKDTFNLARNLYVQGKYELCMAELAKLHEMIPTYENSKELEAFCNQGRELVLRQKDIDRRERERQMLEQQVASVVEGCKEKLKTTGSVEQVRACLSEAIELNPEDPKVVEMIGGAQAYEEEQKLLESQRIERHMKRERGVAMYKKAKALYKDGRLAKAVSEYDHFLNMTFPDVEDVRQSAKREVASIRIELDKKVSIFLQQCKAFGDKGKYKDAYEACSRALTESPKNEEASNLRAKMLANLRHDVKSIYEDSVLEESLGNVDSAKEKWKRIIEEDLSFDDYAIKSKINLKKYGVEM